MIKGICRNKCLKDVYEAKEVDALLTGVEAKTTDMVNSKYDDVVKVLRDHDYDIDRLDYEIKSMNELISYNNTNKFVTLTCSFTHSDAAQRVQVNYPTGFNKDNCVVVSVMCKVNDTERDAWRTGNTDDQHMLTYNAGMYSHIVSLERDYINAYVKPFTDVVTTGGQLKITLMLV